MSIRRAIVCAAMLSGLAAAAPAAQRAASTTATQRATPAAVAALGHVEPGLWQIRAQGERVHNICVIDPATLIQVRHGDAACARMVIADGASTATVHYSCPGAGWGRTSVRASSPTSVRIDTQGIADNAPFAFVAEAHRTGACGATRAALVR